MSGLAPILQSFFTDRMITQKHASRHTIRSYRDTFRLLLTFAQHAIGSPPWKLDISQLDADLITSFLCWLETERNNSPRTRNARLSAVRSLFRYAALRAPDNAATIQRVLAIEASRIDTTVVNWLTDTESDALLAVPDRSTWIGRRDYALLVTALRTGLRVSELTQLTRRDLHLGAGAHVRCVGKDEKNAALRSTPTPSRRYANGSPNTQDTAETTTRCSPPGKPPRCHETPSTPGSPNTRRSLPFIAPRWPTKTSLHTL
jgi:integrase/recombinase XerD